MSKILQTSGNFNKSLKIDAKISKILKMQLDIYVDLEKCEKMSLLSLSEASIQKCTSTVKFARSPCTDPQGLDRGQGAEEDLPGHER